MRAKNSQGSASQVETKNSYIMYVPKDTITLTSSVQHLCQYFIVCYDWFAPLTLFLPEIKGAVLCESCVASGHCWEQNCRCQTKLNLLMCSQQAKAASPSPEPPSNKEQHDRLLGYKDGNPMI